MFEDPKCAIRKYQLVKNSIPMTRMKKTKKNNARQQIIQNTLDWERLKWGAPEGKSCPAPKASVILPIQWAFTMYFISNYGSDGVVI